MRNEQGITFVGMLLAAAIVMIAGILLMKIVPVYIENYAVKQSIQVLRKIPSTEFSLSTEQNEALIKEKLIRQLEINGLMVAPDHIFLQPKSPGLYKITVKYQVFKPLIGNINLMFDFVEFEEVDVGPK